MNKSLSTRITGMVQGVGFRYYVSQQARHLGLAGYVRNLPDGSVEAEVEGEEDKLKQFIVALKAGPSGAVVEEVKVEWGEYGGRYRGVNITH
ncbi:MAG: acylphosphatase [Candidatus Edwardsbacteria bacterium GWF2_54_11]|uniref:Acylphosphatase n=1 Tax=Candidatus Edwardsbacteria bacterium GWF2_54_11 TaxID=1817851 RepID=A0A1F5RFS6_9BACT|nr:MAG: acylphosphatase [Candidatus Edwardsbacteria bacterium GWF2_54_11]